MVKLLCSRRGNYEIYVASVTPYIPGWMEGKILLLEHVNYFAIHQILTKNITGICIMVSIGKQPLFYNQLSHDYSITVKKNFW